MFGSHEKKMGYIKMLEREKKSHHNSSMTTAIQQMKVPLFYVNRFVVVLFWWVKLCRQLLEREQDSHRKWCERKHAQNIYNKYLEQFGAFKNRQTLFKPLRMELTICNQVVIQRKQYPPTSVLLLIRILILWYIVMFKKLGISSFCFNRIQEGFKSLHFPLIISVSTYSIASCSFLVEFICQRQPVNYIRINIVTGKENVKFSNCKSQTVNGWCFTSYKDAERETEQSHVFLQPMLGRESLSRNELHIVFLIFQLVYLCCLF